jgi:UDP-2,4-diacetamido-2,4,6-trideoxy-beta-L-altropyranose hydrolase
MPNPILFRFDANSAIGFGHATRCFALSQELSSRGYHPHFAVSADTVSLLNTLGIQSEQVHIIDHRIASLEDAEATSQLAKGLSTQWIIIDGYEFDAKYQAALKKNQPIHRLVIDDGVIKSFDAEILLNQNLDADVNHSYMISEHTKLLFGSRYTLFRSCFKGNKPIEIHDTATNITLMFGGSDPMNITLAVLEILLQSNTIEGRKIRVILGAGYKHLKTIEDISVPDGSSLELVAYSTSIIELLTWSDVVISAAGSTAWELALLGIPMALVTAADNQIPIARALEKHGAAVNLGDIRTFSRQTVEAKLRHLFNDQPERLTLHRNCLNLFDCEGPSRVVNALEEYGGL